MATITDIAKLANVSTSTVSRILNDEQYVAPATAKAVAAAIEELGYVPRTVRPGPKSRKRKGVKTGTLAFLSVCSESPVELYAMPAIPSLLAGVQWAAEQGGMEVVMAHMPDPNVLPPVLANNRVDGLVVLGPIPRSGPLEKMLRRIPSISCYLANSSPVPGLRHVLYDNSRVGQLAADYLLGRGHQHIAFLGDRPEGGRVGIERRDEFLRGAGAAGVAVDVIEGHHPESVSYGQYAEVLLDRFMALSPRPTGVFCVTADLMLSVFNGLHRRGLEPQVDVELIGCNNDQGVMNQMHPRPATIDIKFDVVGAVAVEQLLWQMANPDKASRGDMLIVPELIPSE